jgi:hypothetical protein
VGSRIAKSYVDRALDNLAAVRSMLQSTDAKAFLTASGWAPRSAIIAERPADAPRRVAAAAARGF